MNPKLLAGLILCNLVWSAHPLMGKWVLQDFTPEQGAWLRYFSAWVAYLACVPWLRRLGLPFLPVRRPYRRSVRPWALAALLGLMAFCISPLLIMKGLSQSTATENAVIIALEPLITVALARVFLGERTSFRQLAAFTLAILGFALLSGLEPERFTNGLDAHLLGNLTLLASLVGEAGYSVMGRKLLMQFEALSLFGSALVCGVVFLTACFIADSGKEILQQPGLLFSHLSLRSAIGVLWVGPLGTAGAYLYWIFALAYAPVSALAVTLFLQPVFGSLWAYLFLHERLDRFQLAGALLMVGAVILNSIRKNSSVVH